MSLRAGPQWRLHVLALAGAGLYAWLALRYPLYAGLARGRASWAILAGGALGAGLLHAAVYGLLILLYMLALRHVSTGLRLTGCTHASSTLLIIWLGWLAAAAILLNCYPGESLDVFDYLFRGRLLAEYGISPLAHSPSQFADRLFYRYITWRGQVDTYGPLWEYASGGTAWAVGRLLPRPHGATIAALAAYVTGYRLLAVALSSACGLLVYTIVRHRSAGLAPAALLAWLWNPLLLTATAIGAHNDLLVALGVLACLWLLQRARWLLGLVALLLAAHVKLTALLLLPVVALWLIRRIGWWQAWAYGLCACVGALPISWLLYAPLGGWATLPRMLRERTLFLANAPADLLYRWLREQAGWATPDARRLAILSATALFCLIAGVLIAVMLDARAALPAGSLGRCWHWHNRKRSTPTSAPDDTALWRCGLAVTSAYLLVGSFWFMPWYVLWALPLAALLPASGWMRWWVPALILGALWSGLAADFVLFAPAPGYTPTQASWASVLALLGPPLAVAGYRLVLPRV